MEKYWKWIILAVPAVLCIVFTIIAFGATEKAAFPIMLGVDAAVVIAGVLFYLKYGKK